LSRYDVCLCNGDMPFFTPLPFPLVNKRHSGRAFVVCSCYLKKNDSKLLEKKPSVAISQRDYTQPYPFLEREKTAIRRDIMEFFEEIIRPNFPAEVTRPTDNYDDVVQEYVFDCYIDRKRQVWLMDFNVWGSQTDPLLFEWSELVTMGHDRNAAVREVTEEKPNDEAARGTANTCVLTSTPLPEIRIVSGNEDIRCDPLASYRAPIDAMDLTSDSFQKFMSTCKQES